MKKAAALSRAAASDLKTMDIMVSLHNMKTTPFLIAAFLGGRGAYNIILIPLYCCKF